MAHIQRTSGVRLEETGIGSITVAMLFMIHGKK